MRRKHTLSVTIVCAPVKHNSSRTSRLSTVLYRGPSAVRARRHGRVLFTVHSLCYCSKFCMPHAALPATPRRERSAINWAECVSIDARKGWRASERTSRRARGSDQTCSQRQRAPDAKHGHNLGARERCDAYERRRQGGNFCTPPLIRTVVEAAENKKIAAAFAAAHWAAGPDSPRTPVVAQQNQPEATQGVVAAATNAAEWANV